VAWRSSLSGHLPVNRPGSSAARKSRPPQTGLPVIAITAYNAGLVTSDSLFPNVPSLCCDSSLPHTGGVAMYGTCNFLRLTFRELLGASRKGPFLLAEV